MGVPVVLVGQCFVNAVVEIFVVGENDVAADIVELGKSARSLQLKTGRLTNPSGVTSVEARPPGVSLESIIIHEGPSCEGQLSVWY